MYYFFFQYSSALQTQHFEDQGTFIVYNAKRLNNHIRVLHG